MARLTRSNLFHARDELLDLVHRAAYAQKRTVLSYRGKDLALIVPIEDSEFLKHLPPETLNRLDLEQFVTGSTETLLNGDGLLRFTAAGLRAARRRQGVQRESTNRPTQRALASAAQAGK